MKRIIALTCLFVLGCDTSDDVQRRQQEVLLKEGASQVGMPAIKNFRERKILKDILELRDQDGLVTYTYIFSSFLGKFVYVGESIGYPIPAATQFTNPQKRDSTLALPQADPNGLFSPSAAEATWVLLKDPSGKTVKPAYFEERIVCLPFRLPDRLVVSSGELQ